MCYQKAFAGCAEGVAIQNLLANVMNDKLSEGRKVQPMPLACKTNEEGERYWVGPDIILEKLATAGYKGIFELRSETICRQLLVEGGHITGALIEHLPTKTTEEIKAKIVIVAADTLRTPQILWASGIRPKAFGHYLNEHPFVFCSVELNDDMVDKSLLEDYEPSKRTEPTVGVF